jgi:hypothetical protein
MRNKYAHKPSIYYLCSPRLQLALLCLVQLKKQDRDLTRLCQAHSSDSDNSDPEPDSNNSNKGRQPAKKRQRVALEQDKETERSKAVKRSAKKMVMVVRSLWPF